MPFPFQGPLHGWQVSHYVLCALPVQESGLWISRVPGHMGKEGPTWLPEVNSVTAGVPWLLPENKTKSPPGSLHPVLFENKHAIIL